MFFQINKTNNHLNLNQKSIQSGIQNLNIRGKNTSDTLAKENHASVRRNIKSEQRDIQKKQNANGVAGNSIVESSFGYAETIRSGRLKSKKTALAVKKLQYNFKSISSKLMRSKTSTSAREVASQAGREVLRLKRMKQNKSNNAEELEAAITHAKAMERLAKKKAAHLEEEELVKVAQSGGPCAGEIEEKDESANEAEAMQDESYEEMQGEEEFNADNAYDLSQMYESMQMNIDELMEALDASMSDGTDIMDQFMDEMNDAMEELLEESGLGDLLDELSSTKYEEMDPADYKMMKIKHRCKEMKEQAQADAEYLKAIFDQLEKQKSGSDIMRSMNSGNAWNGGQSATPMIDLSAAAGNVVSSAENHIDILL